MSRAKDKKQQKQIFKEINTELETHTRLEETIFIQRSKNTKS
jgi:hypothetical protein